MSKRTIDSFFSKQSSSIPKKPKCIEETQAKSNETDNTKINILDKNPPQLKNGLVENADRTAQFSQPDASARMQQASEVVKASRSAGEHPKLEQLLVESGWKDALHQEFRKEYFQSLEMFVAKEWCGAAAVYPPEDMIFRAFNTCALKDVRVVIIGQDPYHGPNQAMGLCFSVPRGEKVPSSLQNMYKELEQDLGYARPKHGDLHKWATQGVLLLNTCLTVRAHQANSHSKKGWEVFTDQAIRTVSAQRKNVVFLLWGNAAKEKARLIDANKHVILKAAHPSGLSASRGFFGCKHFSAANKAIERAGGQPIDWKIDP